MIQACHAVGLGERFKTDIHQPHKRDGKRLCVTTVRHPLDWLASYYRSIYPGKCGVPIVDKFASIQADNFIDFVQAVMEKYPGGVGSMFIEYNADSYVRLEKITRAMDVFFSSLGLDPTPIYGISPKNINTGKAPTPRPDWLVREFMRSERYMCEVFGYDG